MFAGLLAFAPATSILSDNPRYYYAPAFFTILGLALIFDWAASSSRVGSSLLHSTCLTLLLIWVPTLHQKIREEVQPSLVQQEVTIDWLRDHVADWPEEAQIVLLVDKMQAGWTNGYNHWSAWFLRYATGRRDLTGLIGEQSWIAHDPWVSEYRDHGEEYWKPNSVGRLSRLQMVGLDKAQPTFVYSVRKHTIAQHPGFVSPQGGGFDWIGAGASAVKPTGRMHNLKEICDWNSVDSDIVLLPSTRTKFECPELLDRFRFDGFSSIEVPTKSIQGDLKLCLSLRSDSEVIPGAFSASQPPMPLVFGPVTIYETHSGRYLIGTKQRSRRLSIEDVGELQIEIRASSGCGYSIFANGFEWFQIDRSVTFGSLTIGKGYRERFWKGEIARLELKAVSSTEVEQLVPLQFPKN